MNIEIKGLSKKYYRSKTKSLDSVNMTIPKGVFGLLGENGAGKTSLLKNIATVMPIQEGNIVIDGYNLKDNTEEVRKFLGYLPQKMDFFESLTVYEMLDYIALVKNVNSDVRDKEIRKIVKDFNLEDKIFSRINKLSGGMKQRVAIAQSIIGNSRLIILDEPTVGLDPSERLRFRNIINEISKNRTIIISTHIISDISMLCSNIGIMKNGKIIYCGLIGELLENLEGKIFIETLHIDEIIDKKKYKRIISITRNKDTVKVRFISDNGLEKKLESSEPTLEDAYFYWMSMGEGKNYV